MALGKTLGKVPVLAGNCDGFIGNRMLGFYGLEASSRRRRARLRSRSIGSSRGSASMGPAAVRDLAGNDVGGSSARDASSPPMSASPILERLVSAGRLGQKAGKGLPLRGTHPHPDPQVLVLIEGVSRDPASRAAAFPMRRFLERCCTRW
jgi:3-hydroxyacyl-CoA dehydrogenase